MLVVCYVLPSAKKVLKLLLQTQNSIARISRHNVFVIGVLDTVQLEMLSAKIPSSLSDYECHNRTRLISRNYYN